MWHASGFQYEGYAYLGAGMLVLAGVGIPIRLWSILRSRWPGRTWQHLPLVLALLFLAAMAVGPTVTAGARTLLTYDVSWWGPFLAFRTHARMIWPVYYAVVLAILFAATRLRYTVAAVLLASAVLMQAVDLAGMARYVGQVGVWGYRDPLNSRFWRVVPRHYERLVLFPSNLCDRDGIAGVLLGISQTFTGRESSFILLCILLYLSILWWFVAGIWFARKAW